MIIFEDVSWAWVGITATPGGIFAARRILRRVRRGDPPLPPPRRIFNAMRVAGHIPMRFERHALPDTGGIPQDEIVLVSDSLARSITIDTVQITASGHQGPPEEIMSWRQRIDVQPGGSQQLAKVPGDYTREHVTVVLTYHGFRFSRGPCVETLAPVPRRTTRSLQP